MNQFAPLHYLTQDSVPGFSHLQQVQLALSLGAPWIQIRTKNQNPLECRAIIASCIGACKNRDVTVIVNDYVDLAVELGAQGVHLGVHDGDPAIAREQLGPGKILGLSTHNPREVKAALAAGADYLGLGPFRHTTTKAVLDPVLGLGGIESCLPLAGKVPVVAIGGIGFADIQPLIGVGVQGVAVSSLVNNSPDPATTLKKLLQTVSDCRRTPIANHRLSFS